MVFCILGHNTPSFIAYFLKIIDILCNHVTKQLLFQPDPIMTSLSRILLSFFVILALSQGAEPEKPVYQVLEPEKSARLIESDHFVARWNTEDQVSLNDDEIKAGLEQLEKIYDFYINQVGFFRPYDGEKEKFKISINISDKGWATGSGTGRNHPAMWVHYNAFKHAPILAHEFAHCLQFGAMGMRDSKHVGWFWESHAEWMTHQMFPESAGVSFQLVEAPHLYYGTTRNRYGNWQFWQFIKDRYGYSTINEIWTKSAKPGDPQQPKEDPLMVLMRNRNWKIDTLNDHFGRWAMQNVTWDYSNGEVLRKAYGSYDDRSGSRRNRVAILDPIDAKRGRYRIPHYWAPQRYGYNLIRLLPQPGQRSLQISFRGMVQSEPAVSQFGDHDFEPQEIQAPGSDWRWGVVAVESDGKPRYSSLQRGSSATQTFPLNGKEKEVWLAVCATPKIYHPIMWDQMYYTIYRYPWAVEIKGATPRGSESAIDAADRSGAPHPNGGGWVDASAKVAATAFVAHGARVLDQAIVTDRARIEGYAVVSATARVQDDAVISGRALVTGGSVISGNARIADDAAVFGGTISDQAQIGALTIIEGEQTAISGKTRIAAVMNTLRDLKLSGDVQLLGDLELHHTPTKGVFYGIIDKNIASNPRMGANRTSPEPEVTAPYR